MKKLLIVMSIVAALAVSARAAEGEASKESAPKKSPGLTAEQRALRKELTEKYDTNKNKRLDKEERSKMTPEDTKKWESVSPAPRAAKPADGEKKKEK